MVYFALPFSEFGSEWKDGQSDQLITWRKIMEILTRD